jgi:hypothetical protein
MIVRPTRSTACRSIACATLALLTIGVALANITQISLLTGPTATAQVGVFYNSGITVQNGLPPYHAVLTSGALPPGLSISRPAGNSPLVPITGTPLPAASGNTYNFTVEVTDFEATDPNSPSASPDSQMMARRRRLMQSGNLTDSISPSFSITVQPAAPSPTPVPPSVWMAMTGLAGAGLFRLRQKRRG